MKELNNFYNQTVKRFWNPLEGLVGRDKVVFSHLINGDGIFLEYGFGSGSLLLSVAKNLNYSKVHGYDISDIVIENLNLCLGQIEGNWKDKVSLFQSTDDTLTYHEENSVNVIVSVATLEHVINPYVVLDEFHRVAKDNSFLVCSVPNYAYIKHRITLMLGGLPKTGTNEPVEKWREVGWDGMHLHTFTLNAFKVLLADCGWEPIYTFGWGYKYKLIRKLRVMWPSIFSGELITICRKAQS